MNEFTSWTAADWYRFGTLLVELGLLVTGVWFARNLLRRLSIFQEQFGALLKLTITAAPAEPHVRSVEGKDSPATANSYWLMPSDMYAHPSPEPTQNRPSPLAVAWHDLVLWLSAPMGSSRISAWRRAMNWLQAPSGS
jgi:hypothetical protein